MKCRLPLPSVHFSQLPRVARLLATFTALTLLLTVAQSAAGEKSQQEPEKAFLQQCKLPSLDLSGTNDVEIVTKYEVAVARMVSQGRFEELDCLADSARSTKERFPGGGWKLRALYLGAAELHGHSTDQDWQAQLERVQKWMAARPQSITARVALAHVYVDYAWAARGTDMADSVTKNGWKLFEQRLAQAKAILDDASSLRAKCPDWYLAMQHVALGQGWDPAQEADLLKRAVSFEPEYYYNYLSYAHYLMPQWGGEEGDASRFAQASADRLGGDAGDILYFQIGTEIVCACNQPEFSRMSWPRLQRGYALLEKKYGVSILQLNSLALMATKSGDPVVADEGFKRIGDNYVKADWITEDYFKQSKTWAAQMGPVEQRSRKIVQEAESGLATAEGVQYQKKVEQALAPFVRQCLSNEFDDQEQFDLVLQVGKDGTPDDAWPKQLTNLAQCMVQRIYEAHLKKETPFPPPPHAAYWLKIHVERGLANLAAK